MSDFKSVTEFPKTETPYFPKSSINVLLDTPAILAACPKVSLQSSYNLEARKKRKSYSFISKPSGILICIVFIFIDFKFNQIYEISLFFTYFNTNISRIKTSIFHLPSSSKNLKQIIRGNTLIVFRVIYRSFGEKIVHRVGKNFFLEPNHWAVLFWGNVVPGFHVDFL